MKKVKKYYNIITQKENLLTFLIGFFLYMILNIFATNEQALLGVALIAMLKEVYDVFNKNYKAKLLDFIILIAPGILIYLSN